MARREHSESLLVPVAFENSHFQMRIEAHGDDHGKTMLSLCLAVDRTNKDD